MLEVEVFSESSLGHIHSPSVCIVPDPQTADLVRSKKSELLEVFPISTFIQRELDLRLQKKMMKKDEVMLYLSLVWSQLSLPEHYSQFITAINLFTELRSFSVNLSSLDSILDEFSKEEKLAQQAFYHFFEQEDFIDEQKAYFLLAEFYRQHLTQLDLDFYVYGFDFLSGVQIDFLKALGIAHHVKTIIPSTLLQKLKDTDWPSWLSVKKYQQSEEKDYKPKVILIPKNQLYPYLKEAVKDFENYDFILGSKGIRSEDLLELPLENHFFKIPNDLFEDELVAFEHYLEEHYLGRIIKSEEVEEKIKIEIKNGNFRRTKVFMEFLKLHKKIENFTSNKIIGFFEIKLFSDLIGQNLTRTYFIPLTLNENQNGVYSLKNLQFLEKDSRKFFCITSKMQPLASDISFFNQKTIQKLASIGPIKRNELALYAMAETIREMATYPNSFFFIESDLWERDLNWRFILGENCEFKNFSSEKLSFRPKDPLIINNEKNNEPIRQLSATAFQLYLDCPRRYFYTYRDRILSEPKLQKSLDYRELGILQHKIIEESFFDERSLDFIKKKSKRILNQFIEENNKKLDEYLYQKYFIELSFHSYNGLKLLGDFEKKLPNSKFFFEKRINQEDKNGLKHTGSVDCFIEREKEIILLDFKRSSFSVPSIKQIESFEKVQLWYYASRFSQNIAGFGYLNLSETGRSLLLWNEESSFKNLVSLEMIYKETDLMGKREEYQCFESEKIGKLLEETRFSPDPKKSDICGYCEFKGICSKGLYES